MIYGILLSIITGILAKLLSIFVPSFGSVTIAIFLGIIIKNLIMTSDKSNKGTKLIEKKLLPIAIMLLGAQLNFTILIDLGYKSILFIILLVCATILSGYFLASLFGFNKQFGLLLGTGNAVCGSSAIAASSQVLDVDEAEIGLSIAVVNLMGTIGIFLLPFISKVLGFSDMNSGMLIGGSLQAVGQAVAAGFSVNESVGKIATIIKMGRVLTLGVVILIFEHINSRAKTKTFDKSKTKKIKINIPYFIVGFFIISLISSFGLISNDAIVLISKIGKYLLLFSMSAIGLRINFKSLLLKGSNLLKFEIVIEFVQIMTAVSLIYLLFIL